jgi:rieske iron-sulfur protein
VSSPKRIVLELLALDKGEHPIIYREPLDDAQPQKGDIVGDTGDMGAGPVPCYARRRVLQATLGTGLGLLLAERTAAQDIEPRNARPQEGDRFVFSTGARKGVIITPEDLSLGGPPVTAYPADPHTGLVRYGSRLNQVLLIRLDPAELSETIRTQAPQGLVAYSAICTHTGCDVSDWQGDTKLLMCFCHYSLFDPKDGARVVGGPAPRRLAMLPLKVVEGVLMAAGSFVGRVGFQQG